MTLQLRLAVLPLTVALIACDSPAATNLPASADVLFTVQGNTISAPDSVRPGWSRIRVAESGESHIVVLFRMPATSTANDVATFVAALDSAPRTPSPAVAIGGAELGARGDVIVRLSPGTYVAACVRRSDDGHRHASAGEQTVLHVRAETPADSVYMLPPTETLSLQMADFAFVGPEQWTAGSHMLRLENNGKQDHQLRLVRLHDGVTLEAWMKADDPGDVATPIAGMARVGAGEVAYLPLTLARGTYIATCLVADQASGRPHIDLGMLRAIRVP